ncbi:MAG: HD domain-containing phosphohydrolase, partial [Bacillota bacterium]|nr:HD domain-containing phosphohydrolase [Bacillota bacterium]
KALRIDRENLETLAVGALLHDIGTVKLPKELLIKRTTFSEQEAALYKKHTEHGFEILRSKRELNLVSAHIALQHHEWLNGNGYPRNLSGTAIHSLAQIVGIVDFYDNLVNDGPGHLRVQPNEACEILMGSANKLFAHELVTTFLKYVAAYPTGSTVRLNTGEVGIVVDQNKSLPMRPIIRVLKGANSLDQISAKEYNLVKDLTTFIKEIIE